MLPHIQGGYYNDEGKWVRQKFCLLPCRDCNCMPPGGVWDKNNPPKEMFVTHRKQKSESSDGQ